MHVLFWCVFRGFALVCVVVCCSCCLVMGCSVFDGCLSRLSLGGVVMCVCMWLFGCACFVCLFCVFVCLFVCVFVCACVC